MAELEQQDPELAELQPLPGGETDEDRAARRLQSIIDQQSHLEAARRQVARDRQNVDSDRTKSVDRMALETADLERQRAELEAMRAALLAEQQAWEAQNRLAAETSLEDEPASEMSGEAEDPSERGADEQPPEEELATAESTTDESTTDESPRAAAAGGSHEEESIEDYMAGLLKRMRGGADVVLAPQVSRAKQSTAPTSVEHKTAAATAASTPVEAVEKPPAQVEKPRRAPPIETTDLAAMREFANMHARFAIDLHGNKRLIKKVFGSFVASLVFLIATAAVMIVMPNHPVLDTGVMVGVVAAIYWMLGGVKAAQQLKKTEPIGRVANGPARVDGPLLDGSTAQKS
jgi:hypothetical protein